MAAQGLTPESGWERFFELGEFPFLCAATLPRSVDFEEEEVTFGLGLSHGWIRFASEVLFIWQSA